MVHELRVYFGFFKLTHTCESTLRFSSYDGDTNYLKLRIGGLQGDPPEFMVYFLVTVHIWWRIFKMFPELRDLVYVDDTTIIGRLSQALKLTVVSKSVFKSDDNLDFNMGKTEFLTKGPTTRHVFEQAQSFLQTGHCRLHQGFCGSKLHKDYPGRGEVWALDWWFHTFSTGTKDYEHTHTIHECKHNFVTPRAIFNSTAHSCRYNHRQSYTPKRYSRLQD